MKSSTMQTHSQKSLHTGSIITTHNFDFDLKNSFVNSINLLIGARQFLEEAEKKGIIYDLATLTSLVNCCACALTYVLTLSYHPEYMEIEGKDVSELINKLCELSFQISTLLTRHNLLEAENLKLQNQLELGFKLGLVTQCTGDDVEKNIREVNLELSNLVEIVKHRMQENQSKNQGEWTSKITEALIGFGFIAFTLYTGGLGVGIVAIGQSVGILCTALKSGIGFYQLHQKKLDFIEKNKIFFLERIAQFAQLEASLNATVKYHEEDENSRQSALKSVNQLTLIIDKQRHELQTILENQSSQLTNEEKEEINLLVEEMIINNPVESQKLPFSTDEINILIEHAIIEHSKELSNMAETELKECRDFLDGMMESQKILRLNFH